MANRLSDEDLAKLLDWAESGSDFTMQLARVNEAIPLLAELRDRRDADLTQEMVAALRCLRDSIIEKHGGTFALDMSGSEMNAALAVLDNLLWKEPSDG